MPDDAVHVHQERRRARHLAPGAVAPDVAADRGQHAVDEAGRVVGGEPLGELDGLVDDDALGLVGLEGQLEGPQAQELVVDGGQALDAPPAGSGADEVVEQVEVVADAHGQQLGVGLRGATASSRRVRSCSAKATSPTRCSTTLAALPAARIRHRDPVGQVFGELGLISPGNVRTQTVECLEDGQALTASYQMVKELYFQNPEFGFYFLRLTSERLFQNISRLEEELAHKNAQLAALALKPA